VRPASDGQHLAAGGKRASPTCLIPIVGTSNRMSCCGLATLTTVKPAGAAERPGAADALVGPLDRLDRQHRLVFDGHALPNVEPAHLLGHLPAKFDILLLPGRRAAAGKAVPLSRATPVRNR